jgi:AAA+ superfamily predicted ATPase
LESGRTSNKRSFSQQNKLKKKKKKKRPLGRPRTLWVNVIAQYIKNIEEESYFNVYDKDKWRGFLMAAMILNGSIS